MSNDDSKKDDQDTGSISKDEQVSTDENNDLLENFEDILDDNLKAKDVIEEKKVEQDEMVDNFKKFENEIKDLRETLARSQADYQNLLRRNEREKFEMTFFINSSVVLKILPFVDNIERLIGSTPEEQRNTALFEGIKSTYLGIIKQLESMGVKSFDSVGQKSDTNFHDIMSQCPGEEGIVMQEFEKGYSLYEKVIRHAKVIVGSGVEL